jgi:hypothetical protein
VARVVVNADKPRQGYFEVRVPAGGGAGGGGGGDVTVLSLPAM